MEDKLLELITLKEYFQEQCSTYAGNQINSGMLETVIKSLRDIFTSTNVTRFTESTVENQYATLNNMKTLPSIYGGVDNINKFERAKEIALDWVQYKNDVLANASTRAYLTVSLNNTGQPVITLTDPYGQP